MFKKYVLLLIVSNALFSMDYMRLKFFPVNDEGLSEILRNQTFPKEEQDLVVDALKAVNFGMLKPDAFKEFGYEIFARLLQCDEIPISLIENLSEEWKDIVFVQDLDCLCQMVRRQSVKLLTYFFDHLRTDIKPGFFMDYYSQFRLPGLVHQLIETDNVDCLQLFIDKGLPIDKPDENGISLIFSAAVYDASNLNIVKFLLSKGVILDDEIFNFALENTRNQKILLLFLEHQKASYQRALQLAIEYNRAAIFEKYIYQQSDAKIKSNNYMYALVYAACNRQIDAFKTLYSRNVSLVRNTDSILSAVMEGRSIPILEFLLKDKNSSFFKNCEEQPFDIAIKRKNAEMALVLMNAGFLETCFSDATIGKEYGQSIIFRLLSVELAPVLDAVLKKYPVFLEAVNADGKTPLEEAIYLFSGWHFTITMTAKERENAEYATRKQPVIEVLLSHGANTHREGIPDFLHTKIDG